MKKIILGVDPGTVVMGYSVISSQKNQLELLAIGVLKLQKYGDTFTKLKKIYDRIASLCQEYSVQEVAVEAPFFGKNVQSMLKLGRAQGIAIVAGLNHEANVFEYLPKKVKQSVTGNGNATKEQVAAMLKNLIKMPNTSFELDATDALAVAVCHHFQFKFSDNTPKFNSWKDFITQNTKK